MLPSRLVAALAAFVAAASAPAAELSTRLGGVEVVAWTPHDDPARTRAPVVVFSHALGLCPTQARFLTTSLAEAGYLVIAPYHADSACEFSIEVANVARLPFKPANLWTDADFRDRADDVARVLEALPRHATLGPVADVDHVALAGHSLGGYTVLGLAGAWPAWRTPPGVRAVVAMSPYVLPLLANGAIDRLAVPVMFQTGAQDLVFSLPVASGAGAYAHAPAPKMLVEFDYGTHFAWTDAGLFRREAIVAVTLAFLDRHVRGVDERPDQLAAIDGEFSLRSDPPSRGTGVPRPSIAERTTAAVNAWWQRARDLWPF